MREPTKLYPNLVFLICLFLFSCSLRKTTDSDTLKSYFSAATFQYDIISGIGHEAGCTRRDNSDIIRVGDKYYIYYTKVYGQSPGYWGTIWAAVSEDEGFNWTELGEVLGKGDSGQWDSQAVFTPNIIEENGTYYLYYTGVQPTPTSTTGEFENNSVNDYTAIGVAKATTPEGPFVRCSNHPVLTVSNSHDQFDSYRVDDAVLLKKDGLFRLYYKGRKYDDGENGPLHTQMGVAMSPQPEGPFEKYDKNPILDKSHEVFLWKQHTGVACLASISHTFEYAEDGLDFTSRPLAAPLSPLQRPNAPGAYRPELTNLPANNELTWGISMIHHGDESFLTRWTFSKNN